MYFQGHDIEIVRSRDERDIARGDIVFDVGGVYDPSNGRFDHHQQGGAGARDNGIPYASFGLVWKEYGHVVAGSVENAQFIDEQLVQCIDAHDNVNIGETSVRVYAVGDVISAFRPTWQERGHSSMRLLDAKYNSLRRFSDVYRCTCAELPSIAAVCGAGISERSRQTYY